MGIDIPKREKGGTNNVSLFILEVSSLRLLRQIATLYSEIISGPIRSVGSHVESIGT